MSYEHRFYIVQEIESSAVKIDGLNYASRIAIFDVGKDDGIEELVKRASKQPTCYFYETDGETVITEDAYGEPPMEVDYDAFVGLYYEVVWHLNQNVRFLALAGMVRSLHYAGVPNLKIIHVGY